MSIAEHVIRTRQGRTCGARLVGSECMCQRAEPARPTSRLGLSRAGSETNSRRGQGSASPASSASPTTNGRKMLAARKPYLCRFEPQARLSPRWNRLFSSTSVTFSIAPPPKHYYVTTPIFYVNAGKTHTSPSSSHIATYGSPIPLRLGRRPAYWAPPLTTPGRRLRTVQ